MEPLLNSWTQREQMQGRGGHVGGRDRVRVRFMKEVNWERKKKKKQRGAKARQGGGGDCRFRCVRSGGRSCERKR